MKKSKPKSMDELTKDFKKLNLEEPTKKEVKKLLKKVVKPNSKGSKK